MHDYSVRPQGYEALDGAYQRQEALDLVKWIFTKVSVGGGGVAVTLSSLLPGGGAEAGELDRSSRPDRGVTRQEGGVPLDHIGYWTLHMPNGYSRHRDNDGATRQEESVPLKGHTGYWVPHMPNRHDLHRPRRGSREPRSSPRRARSRGNRNFITASRPHRP